MCSFSCKENILNHLNVKGKENQLLTMESGSLL